MEFEGFDWDEGNWPKCGKHGVSRREIEEAITNASVLVRDPNPNERRVRIVGVTAAHRHVFVVVTFRAIAARRLVRPISARYMHAGEIADYERRAPEGS